MTAIARLCGNGRALVDKVAKAKPCAHTKSQRDQYINCVLQHNTFSSLDGLVAQRTSGHRTEGTTDHRPNTGGNRTANSCTGLSTGQ